MHGYYDEKLSAVRLRRVYEIAPPRVKRYLEAEVRHVLEGINKDDAVLDLGCGYGRTLARLAGRSRFVVGVDTSAESLRLARRVTASLTNCRLVQMDAANAAFKSEAFDVTVCIQNGLSAFHVDQGHLVSEAVRVTKAGGLVMFSTYSDRFWADRLEWFKLQSEAGLLGEIDDDRTGDGVIVCKDGFTATTIRPELFGELIVGLDVSLRIVEVDGSSLFYEVVRR
jgi:SAM-dependent methyltransferase